MFALLIWGPCPGRLLRRTTQTSARMHLEEAKVGRVGVLSFCCRPDRRGTRKRKVGGLSGRKRYRLTLGPGHIAALRGRCSVDEDEHVGGPGALARPRREIWDESPAWWPRGDVIAFARYDSFEPARTTIHLARADGRGSSARVTLRDSPIGLPPVGRSHSDSAAAMSTRSTVTRSGPRRITRTTGKTAAGRAEMLDRAPHTSSCAGG